MPFLIRIIPQRVIALSFSFLAFLGISPEIKIPTEQEIIAEEEHRQELVTEVLSDYQKHGIDVGKNIVDQIVNTPISEETELEKEVVSQKEYQPLKKEVVPNQNYIPKNNLSITTTNTAQEEQARVTQEAPSDKFSIDDVLVNIICTQKSNNLITANTGSGVIISSDGVVITNAHVAQFFLLAKALGDYKCSLYRENIPTFGYTAELLYIPPDWVRNNADVIKTENPRGTGEEDYAFLYITDNTNPTLSKPDIFNYAKVNATYSAEIGDSISVAGYPGAPKSIADLIHSVNLQIDSTKIQDVFTFGNNKIDVVSTGVTPVAAKGASGGGVFKNNNLIGIIVTTSGSSNNSYINAITANYINRDLQNDLNTGVSQLISGDINSKIESFWKDYGEDLSEILIKEM